MTKVNTAKKSDQTLAGIFTGNKNKIGSITIAGGGIAGIQAALDIAQSGFKVYLVEEKPGLGGVMSQLDKTFPPMIVHPV